VREANACTWSFWRFELVAAVEVADVWATERALHALLAARRVTDRREFFSLSADDARHVFRAIAPPAPAPCEAPRYTPPLPSAPTSHDAEERCKLRAWVEEQYTRVPLREKDSGTKLEALYSAYATASPPVHARLLGKTTFGKMLNAVYPHVGPYKNRARTVSGLYLLRK
jgi:hypothetical protein